VALLTVLLLVAAMSALAVGLLQDTRMALRRTKALREVDQARWYALGAEALARARIGQLQALTPGRTTLAGDWEGRTFRFPLDEGGLLEVTVRDGTACFNLNSLVRRDAESEAFLPDPLAREQFVALMRALEISALEAERIAAAAADWIDPDQRALAGGAEDDAYARAERRLRTGDGPMAEVSELRAVSGVTAEVYRTLRPFLCTLPDFELAPINVNTLRLEDAPLLSMLTRGAISPAQARVLLAARPANGWESLVLFWGQPQLASADPPARVLQQAQVRTRFFDLQSRVVLGGADVVMSAQLEAIAPERIRVRARRWTADE
jgi:general secretion pathway protein K